MDRAPEAKCRLLLPGACEPRLDRLRPRASDFGLATAYAATATGAWLSLATMRFEPVTVASRRVKANTFTRPSILFRPHCPPTRVLVEPPGTAPGSDPLIPCAFITIVRSPGQGEYSRSRGRLKGDPREPGSLD